MRYEQILLQRSYYEQLSYKKLSELERAKVVNEKREQLLSKKTELSNLLRDLKEYQHILKCLKEASDTEDREYKRRRTSYLSSLITEALLDMFPTEGVIAKLSWDFYRKSDVSLELVDKNGNALDPDICSGKLQQYLISFVAIRGVLNGLGIKTMYVDEAFGVAAPAILGKIGNVVQKGVDSGMQIIMVAQNPAVYQELPHRLIQLKKDPVKQRVELISETDF